MILIGYLDDFAAEYRKTWSGLCRGNPRGTHTIGAGGISLRSDFIRWLGRRAAKNKGGNMILGKTIYHDGTIVLVFKNTEKEGEKKTVEHLVAEVICELGKCHQDVPCSAIHFASFGHPFSATQRLRDMKIKFEKARLQKFEDEMFAKDPLLLPISETIGYPYKIALLFKRCGL